MGSFTHHRCLYTSLSILLIVLSIVNGAQIPTKKDVYPDEEETTTSQKPMVEPTVKIKCLSGSMLITIKDAPVNHETGLFSGMVYPKGLSKNSTCLTEYRDHEGTLRYKLPLRSCNTMPQETDDGGIEFFNTIVLQPHLKLITDAGRGYHVRCSYKSRDAAMSSKKPHHHKVVGSKYAQKPQALKSAEAGEGNGGDRRGYGRSLDKYRANGDNFDEDDVYLQDENDAAAAAGNDDGDDIDNEIPMPGCHMKIYNAEHHIANDVKIGDPLTLVINIDKQDTYGLHVTDCIVRDGLGWGEQRLVGEDGCPMDNEIMGQFNYTTDRLAANVTFPAHKFPYTTSVYYQCNVKLCPLVDPECQMAPLCGGKRPKRQANNDNKDEEGSPATIEVFSGLYVNENVDITEGDDDSVSKERTLEDALCVSQRTFAIAIAIAGLILMLAVVAAVLCIMARRSTKTVSNSGSSIYSGPYTNTAFSHSS
ncbi:zona pellucida domain-containing protein piopio isoform X1 [Musca autumnalis]|uniref:zona pellucida domain-containing protein piopio isoform X1 n=1 Tax=Musca autumnalis TaxID=221902 RepID=UPI003CF0DC09